MLFNCATQKAEWFSTHNVGYSAFCGFAVMYQLNIVFIEEQLQQSA